MPADKYSLVGEWQDNTAGLVRQFIVTYFPLDSSIEMFDCKNRRTFVRRTKVDGVSLDNLYVGCSVVILGRLINIIDYASEDTRKQLQTHIEKTFCVIKSSRDCAAGTVVSEAYRRGFRLGRIKRTKLGRSDVLHLFGDQDTEVKLHLTDAHVYGMEVLGRDAVRGWGTAARELRDTSDVDFVYASLDLQRAAKDTAYWFPADGLSRLPLTPLLQNTSLCLVKPHAVQEGVLGEVMSALDEAGFDIMALGTFRLNLTAAEEFYEVYKGIVSEYKAMCCELAKGACVALEVRCRDPARDTAVELRMLLGPADPEIGRLLRPHSLRARFGTSKVQNALHCSDLPEDGLLEVQYFFSILAM